MVSYDERWTTILKRGKLKLLLPSHFGKELSSVKSWTIRVPRASSSGCSFPNTWPLNWSGEGRGEGLAYVNMVYLEIKAAGKLVFLLTPNLVVEQQSLSWIFVRILMYHFFSLLWDTLQQSVLHLETLSWKTSLKPGLKTGMDFGGQL